MNQSIKFSTTQIYFILLIVSLLMLTFYCVFSNSNKSHIESEPLLSRYNLFKPDESQNKVLIETFFASIQEKKYFSQHGEDGVLISLIKLLQLPMNGNFLQFKPLIDLISYF